MSRTGAEVSRTGEELTLRRSELAPSLEELALNARQNLVLSAKLGLSPLATA